jgi:hypothetical protein
MGTTAASQQPAPAVIELFTRDPLYPVQTVTAIVAGLGLGALSPRLSQGP